MTLIILCGPTASGKTSLSIEIAKKTNGEIIGADSIQIYKDLVVGSAAPSLEEMMDIPHHLIGTLPLEIEMNAGKYILEAAGKIAEITERNKTPIMVGGTNFYVDAFLNGLSPVPQIDETARSDYEKSVAAIPTSVLYDKLHKIDEEWAGQISSQNDRQRINRGLLVYEITGQTLSKWNKLPRINGYKGDFFAIGISIERDKLYSNINCRTAKMISSGLIEEVRNINQMGHNSNNCKPLSSIGYKETDLFLKGIIKSKESLTDTISQNTRHLAKRQMTWLKNRNYIEWIPAGAVIESALTRLTQA